MFIISIVEDNQSERSALKEFVEKYIASRGETAIINTFENGEDLIDNYDLNTNLILMDIDMPFTNGLETAKEIRKIDAHVCIIFVTSMYSYAVQCYKVRAFGFLVKPIKYQQLCMELDDALSVIENQKKQYILLKSEGESLKIDLREVIYFEGKMHKVFVHLKDRTIPYNSTLKAVEEACKDKGFFRCHAAFYVNGYNVKRFDSSDVYLTNGDKLPIARARYRCFVRELTDYLGEQL